MEVFGLFALIILAVLVCGGISAASLQGMILFERKKKIELRVRAGTFPERLAKPLILCNTCMASFWGSLVYWIAGACLSLIQSWTAILLWPFAIAAIAFLNHVSWWLYLALKQVATSCPPLQNSGPSSGAN